MKFGKILGFLFIPLLFALGSAVSLDIIYINKTVTPEQLQENPLLVKVLVDSENQTIEYGNLELFVYDLANEEIYCKDSQAIPVGFNGAEVFNFTISKEKCYKDFSYGVYEVKVVATGYTSDKSTFENENKSRFFIVKDLKAKGADLDILYITPNFEKYNKVPLGPYVIHIWVQNTGIKTLEDVKVIFRIYDKYDNLVHEIYSPLKNDKLEPAEVSEAEIYLNLKELTKIKVGEKYIYEIEVKDANGYVNKKIRYPIEILLGDIDTISVYDVLQYPFEVYPGDYVELVFYIRNNLDHDVKVHPVILSKDLELYKELDDVEIKAGENKKIKTVFKIPEDTEKGTYKITLRLETNEGIKYSYDYNLEVSGVEKLIELEIKTPEEICVGEKNKLELTLRSLKEEYWNLEIEANYDKGKIELEKEEVTFGGKGTTEKVKLYIEPKDEGKGKVTIKLKDKITGKIVAEKEIEVEAIKKELAFAPEIKEYIVYIIGFIVAIIVVIIFWLVYKRGEEEKPVR